MKEESLENLFAAARRAGSKESESLPAGFAEKVLQRHRSQIEQNSSFFRASVLSISTALVILATIAGINAEWNDSSANDDQESTVEMAYALWDPTGN